MSGRIGPQEEEDRTKEMRKDPEAGISLVKEYGHDAISLKVEDDDAMRSTRRDHTKEIAIEFQDVYYEVTMKSPQGGWFNPLKTIKKKTITKEILRGVSGSVLPSEFLAIMGPSGSGKTTFLSILGGRIPQAKGVTGTISYNDLNYSKALKRKIGFVTQDDTFFAHLTVRETLMYAAILRLPRNLSRAEKIKRADDTIIDLGLERCKNTIIGGPFMRGISGGERKRVSIGHEILIDPSILFLDEPTSGLDSTTALKIVQLLQKIAFAGRTVVTTIHQPSSRIFYSFDKLLLLSEGYPIYFGKSKEAMPHFERVGLSPMLAMNPADFLLDLCTGTSSDISLPRSLKGDEKFSEKNLADQQADIRAFLVDAYKKELEPGIKSDIKSLPDIDEKAKNAILEKRTWNASWWTQFNVLWIRGFKERRHEYLSPLRFYQVFAISIIVGLLWWDSKKDTFNNLVDQTGYLFFTSIFWGFFPLITAIFTFPQERAMLVKERSSDMYQLTAYFLSRTLSDIPMEWLLPIIFLLISYWMAALWVNAGTFFLTLGAVLLTISAAQGCGFLIGALVMDVKKGTTIASVVLLTFMLCGGYYLQSIPAWIGWIKYISFTFYSYRLVIRLQYRKNMTYFCGPPEDVRSVSCPMQDALKGITLHEAWVDALALLAMVIIYRTLAYFALRNMKTRF